MDAMVMAEDPDAMIVQGFEDELEQWFQDTPELQEALITYLDARSKLLAKRRGRGFWPVQASTTGAKGSGKGGRFSGKSKGRGKGGRESLLARIARSTCRLCGQRGHWKAECPSRHSAAASSNSGKMEATTTVAQVLPEDQIPDFEETLLANDEVLEELPDGALEFAEALFSNECVENIRGGLRNIAMKFAKKNKPQTHCNPRQFPVFSSPRQKESCFRATPPKNVPDAPVPQSPALIARSRNQDPSSAKAKDRVMAILDTGASRCVMGEHLLQTFLSQLDVQTRALVRVAPSAVKTTKPSQARRSCSCHSNPPPAKFCGLVSR